ncbi:hypothetical protein [Bradyrhizobium sp. sBnM-33]|uniref:hypothetical protein n=1 Tax=Bradyrhizobium sp. sBnM-33 TaxID=2831780 RepID=UPI001BCE6376|nr:hypothetical protein [Bradyrhizobium sp. sBnM-33]WOH48416.1 hypothetical protein RX328_30450 [Bradyrhizobium sp. sBnM-33]
MFHRLAICVLLVVLFSTHLIGTASPQSEMHLHCLTSARAVIRSDPIRISDAFSNCKPELAAALSDLGLDDDGLRVAFSGITAHSMAPYGASRASTLPDLMAAEKLTCIGYVFLASYFVKALLPSAKIQIAGFDGGVIGNHSQMFVPAYRLLLDPTIGLVAIATFDEVLSGKIISGDAIRVFRVRESTDIEAFAGKVHAALLEGKYKPSDILYFYHGLGQALDAVRENGPLWEAKDIPAIIRTLPTPASDDLESNLRSIWSKAD